MLLKCLPKKVFLELVRRAKYVSTEVKSIVFIETFYCLKHSNLIMKLFELILYTYAQWPRNRGVEGCNCNPRFQKLSHKNAIKREYFLF